MIRFLRSSALVVTALAAACAPSTFDGLTGAGGEGSISPRNAEFDDADKSLDDKAPRPVGPFSSSWVNTARPRFRWALSPGTTGVELELSRTRDFKDVAKRVTATGTDHVMTEDLEPGTWYWRLLPRSATGKGTVYSPVWQVLVRGASPRGSSEAAHGGILDLDGDGNAEILVTTVALVPSEAGGGQKEEWPDIFQLYAKESSAGVVTYDVLSNFGLVYLDDPKASIGAGADIDGDGFADYVVAEVWTPRPGTPGQPEGSMWTVYGGRLPDDDDAAPDDLDAEETDDWIPTQGFTTPPALVGGDFNGDGYGDVSAIFPDVGMTLLGTQDGIVTMMPFTSGKPSATPLAFALGSSDLDGDGLSDLVFSPFDTSTPIQLALGKKTRLGAPTNVVAGGTFSLPGRAIATTTGDFDGDAIEEVAFTTLLADGRPAVCVHSTLKPSLNEHGCWISAAPAAGFGLSIKALDLDGDGRDELLVGGAAGLVALSHAGDGYDTPESTFSETPIAGAYSSAITVLHPGRPGNARWAVLGTDQKSLFIHEGVGEGSLKQSLDFSKISKDQYDFVRTAGTIR